MPNEITTLNEQNKVNEKLLCEYLTTLTNKLNDNERMQFCAVAQAYNLNPFKREIYAVLYVGKDGRNFSIVVGYETYLKRAEECPNYDGYDVSFGVVNGDTYCKCQVYRKDRSHAITSTVWMSEYNTGRSLWRTKPKVMLEKVAICTAFRRAFPSEYGGMPYAPEELATTTEEQLKAQGMTEVSADPAEPVKDWKWLQNRLKEMGTEDKKSYDLVAENIKAQGWNGLKDIPVDRYNDIESWYATAKVVSKMEDKLNNETAEESTPAETETNEEKE